MRDAEAISEKYFFLAFVVSEYIMSLALLTYYWQLIFRLI